MRPTLSPSLKLLFAVFALLLLSACSSELTGIDAPEAVESGQEFGVTVSQQFLEDSDLDGDGSGGLVLGVFIPPEWSANPLATYQGTWDSVPVNFELALQNTLPVTNFAEILESENEDVPEEYIAYLNLSDCGSFIEDNEGQFDGAQFLFFEPTTDMFGGPEALEGDTGEFFFELTPDGNERDSQIVVIHGILFGGTIEEPDAPTQEVLGCNWFPDLDASDEENFVPDHEIAIFNHLMSQPVPVMGGVMIAILSLLLALAGFLVGRRKLVQPG